MHYSMRSDCQPEVSLSAELQYVVPRHRLVPRHREFAEDWLTFYTAVFYNEIPYNNTVCYTFGSEDASSDIDVRRVPRTEDNALLREKFTSNLLLCLQNILGKDVAVSIAKLILPYAQCKKHPDKIMVTKPHVERRTQFPKPRALHSFKKQQAHFTQTRARGLQ